jgi:hypothetical protein
MTTLIMQATPFVGMVAPKLQSICVRLLHAIDAFAEAKMRNAVPTSQLRRAERETDRCRRLIRAGRKSRRAR